MTCWYYKQKHFVCLSRGCAMTYMMWYRCFLAAVDKHGDVNHLRWEDAHVCNSSTGAKVDCVDFVVTLPCRSSLVSEAAECWSTKVIVTIRSMMSWSWHLCTSCDYYKHDEIRMVMTFLISNVISVSLMWKTEVFQFYANINASNCAQVGYDRRGF